MFVTGKGAQEGGMQIGVQVGRLTDSYLKESTDEANVESLCWNCTENYFLETSTVESKDLVSSR